MKKDSGLKEPVSDSGKVQGQNTLYERIPDRPVGTLTEAEIDKWPKRKLCSVIAKRALKAGYDETDEPETHITDLLADLRHLCDTLKLHFAALDREAYGHYVAELILQKPNWSDRGPQ